MPQNYPYLITSTAKKICIGDSHTQKKHFKHC